MAATRALLLAVVLAAAGLAAPAAASAKTVWLCKPGLRDNPCAVPLDVARFSPAGQPLGGDEPARTRRREVDCFYVYPTVSGQPTPTATKRIDPEIRSIVRFQAARYGAQCRLYAPVYRQVTLAGLASATEAQRSRAYADVRAAWRSYLKRDNRGRGVILIGHSQGTFQLRRLLAEEIEPKPRLRRRLVSALLLGGNVPAFRTVKTCRTATQTGCVIAFSVFGGPVPDDAIFGRGDALCTNPASLDGDEGVLEPIYPREPFAPGTAIAAAVAALGAPRPESSATWLAFPGSYSGRCVNENGANVLQIAPLGGAPVLNPVPAPSWGLHFVDANIALGNLERLVRRQIAAYARR